MGPIIGIVCGCAVWWSEIEIEKRLATLTQTAVPVDHRKCSQAERADSNLASKVDIGPGSISMAEELFHLIHYRVCTGTFVECRQTHLHVTFSVNLCLPQVFAGGT